MKIVQNRLFRYTSLSALLNILQTKKLPLLNPKRWEDKNDTYFIEKYRMRSSAEKIFAICFMRGAERFHQWKIFASGGDGVRIEFIKDKLLEHFPASKTLIRKPVAYRRIDTLKTNAPPAKNLPFLKRMPYEDEKEYRIIFMGDGDDDGLDQKSFEIDLSCIAEIKINPWMPKSLRETTTTAIRSIAGCEKLKVSRSTLLENEQWKKIADDVTK